VEGVREEWREEGRNGGREGGMEGGREGGRARVVRKGAEAYGRHAYSTTRYRPDQTCLKTGGRGGSASLPPSLPPHRPGLRDLLLVRRDQTV
jgi:hypothetical protein